MMTFPNLGRCQGLYLFVCLFLLLPNRYYENISNIDDDDNGECSDDEKVMMGIRIVIYSSKYRKYDMEMLYKK